MTPYFDDGQCAIYHGDCAVIAPQLGTFDLLCTDPPYGIGEARGKNKSRSKIAKSKDYGVAAWDDAPPARWVLDMANFRKSSDGPEQFHLYVSELLKRYGRGRIPWAKVSTKFRELKAPDLSAYVIPDPQLSLFGVAS